MDGKHANIQPPQTVDHIIIISYKNTRSFVLMAVVDANYEFIYVAVGCNGRVSDGGVWGNSTLSKRLEQKLQEFLLIDQEPGGGDDQPR